MFDALFGNADLLQHFSDAFDHRFGPRDVEERGFQIGDEFFDGLLVDALRVEEVMDFEIRVSLRQRIEFLFVGGDGLAISVEQRHVQ